jgi:uncharacterized protein
MDLQFKTFPFEVKAAAGDGSTFEGLVSVFHNIDSYGEIVDDGAFTQDLPQFMEDGFIGGLNHDWDNPIGTPQDGTKVVPAGLFLRANVIDTTHGLDVRKMLKAGVVKKLSIGYRTKGAQMLESAEDVTAYWESKGYTPNAQDITRAQYGARLLTRLHLYEGSPVTVPANDLASITAVKAAAAKALLETPSESPVKGERSIPADVRGVEGFLRDAGLSQTEAKTVISHIKALMPPAMPEPTADPLQRDAVSETAVPEAETVPEVKADVTLAAPVEPDTTEELPTIHEPEPFSDPPVPDELVRLRNREMRRQYERFCSLCH